MSLHNTYSHAKAPATVSNCIVGFDCLGYALAEPCDEVICQVRADEKIIIQSIEPQLGLPMDVDKNCASIAIQAFFKANDIHTGVDIHIKKGIPVGSGLGGSSASATAGVLAANALLAAPMDTLGLLPYILQAEKVTSGDAHADNAAACLLGGMTLITPDGVESIAAPNLFQLVCMPDIRIETKQARTCLNEDHTKPHRAYQSKALQQFLTAIDEENFDQLKHCMHEDPVTAARKHLWPHYDLFHRICMQHDALCAFVSGSGPAFVAWFTTKAQAQYCLSILEQQSKHAMQTYIQSTNHSGATILETR